MQPNQISSLMVHMNDLIFTFANKKECYVSRRFGATYEKRIDQRRF